MDKKLKIKLVTPAKTIFEDEIDQATLMTENGQITILPNHIPIVSVLKPGELIIKKDNKETALAVAGGIIEMFSNTLVILADTAEHAEEIDLQRAEEKTKELSAKLATQVNLDITTYKTLQRQLEKHQTRVGVAKKWKK
jgi:F-type H+-transporting ATPase subunit epsilon